MPNNFRLKASSAIPLPRIILIILCISYTLAGLFGRDPWKGEDIIGFSIMHTLSNTTWQDWIIPKSFEHTILETGPLMFWLGALSIKFTNNFVNELNASRIPTVILFSSTCIVIWYSTYLLGKRSETQPFRYAFGGEPSTKNYAQTIADTALLIFLACFGLAEKSHQTTSVVAQCFSVAIIIFSMVKLDAKSLTGLVIWPIGITLLALSSQPILVITTTIFTIITFYFFPIFNKNRIKFLFISIPSAVLGILLWPLLIYLFAPSKIEHLYTWTNISSRYFHISSSNSLLFTIKNFPLFTWPAWPLALWSLFYWKKSYSDLHILAPISATLPLLLLTFLQNKPDNQIFTLILPGLSIIAAFAIPTLRQGILNAIDWFVIFTFTPLAIFIWLVWTASLTGIPPTLTKNITRLTPGIHHSFDIISFLIACLSTITWIYLVHWRINHSPQVIWRSVALSSAGTTLIWILLMTLWLPLINYSRSYQAVSKIISQKLPKNYRCVEPVNIGNSQYAAFSYFGRIHFNDNSEKCEFILRQDSKNLLDPYQSDKKNWNLIWEGQRATDRKERFRLYKKLINR